MNKKQLGWIRLGLAACVILGFFAIFVVMLRMGGIDDGVRILLEIMVGALIGAFSTIVAFYYGSSQGSEDKTEHLVRNGNGS